MRLHSLQHESFEGLGNIEVWAKDRGHTIARTLLYKDEELPDINELDWLVIMGGSMNVYEEEKYPWLVKEKEFIAEAIADKKTILGICLGSQIVADILGGRVTRNEYREIGWFPVILTNEAKMSSVFKDFPDKFTAFHWHGDTFKIPPGAKRIAESEGCRNQAFECGEFIGLQFHLEYSAESINLMLSNCEDDQVDGKYVQKRNDIELQISNVTETKRLLYILLDNMERVLTQQK